MICNVSTKNVTQTKFRGCGRVKPCCSKLNWARTTYDLGFHWRPDKKGVRCIRRRTQLCCVFRPRICCDVTGIRFAWRTKETWRCRGRPAEKESAAEKQRARWRKTDFLFIYIHFIHHSILFNFIQSSLHQLATSSPHCNTFVSLFGCLIFRIIRSGTISQKRRQGSRRQRYLNA